MEDGSIVLGTATDRRSTSAIMMGPFPASFGITPPAGCKVLEHESVCDGESQHRRCRKGLPEVLCNTWG
jgi:hypothetical protein